MAYTSMAKSRLEYLPQISSCQLMDHLHWCCLLAKLLMTATLDFTCLGHLGRWDTDRIISICVMQPKVAKASQMVTVVCRCHQHYRSKLCQCKQGIKFVHDWCLICSVLLKRSDILNEIWRKRVWRQKFKYLGTKIRCEATETHTFSESARVWESR